MDEPDDRDQPPYPEALGRTIRVYRAARDLGRRELADQAEVSYSYLAEIEKGSKYPSTKALHAIANALGLSPAELLTASETLEAPAEGFASDSSEDESYERGARSLNATSGIPPEGARARQTRWFHTGLPALGAKSPRKPAEQVLRLVEVQDFDPDLDRLLAELRGLLREMLPEDQQHVLELARRLAKG